MLFSNSGQLLFSFINVSDHCDTCQLKLTFPKQPYFRARTCLHNFNFYKESYLASYHLLIFFFINICILKLIISNAIILVLKVLGSLGFDTIFERVNNSLILHDKVKII